VKEVSVQKCGGGMLREIGERVIKQVRKGNCKAFNQLVEFYHHSVYQICFIIMGSERETDVLSEETFLYAYLNINYYDGSQKFSLWLYHLAWKLGSNHLKDEVSNDFLDMTTTGENMLDQPVDSRNICTMQREIQQLLMKFSVEERLALVLKSVNQLSIHEICEVLDSSESIIKSYIWQGRERLRKNINYYYV
jgi:RNA polymerase sigma-70 factor, ECF subfamily